MKSFSTQLQHDKNKVALYDTGVSTLAAVNETLKGDAVDVKGLKERLVQDSKTVLESGKKVEKDRPWQVFQEILATVGNQDPAKVFTQSFEEDGVKYKRAAVAVAMENRVYEVQLDVKADDLAAGKVGEYQVTLSSISLNQGVVKVDNIASDLTVKQQTVEVAGKQQTVLSLDMTANLSPERKEQRFGDRNYTLQLEQVAFTPYSHQQGPINVVAGREASNPSPKSAQLVTAGTGTGKTAILAGYAKAMGSGILSAPSELVDQMVKDAADFIGKKPAPVTLEAALGITRDNKLTGSAKEAEDKRADTAVKNKLSTISQQELDSVLQRNPYVVASHEQLLQMAPKLQDKHIFVDEAHELTINTKQDTKDPAVLNTPNKEKIAQLKQVTDNNISLVVTATPTKAINDTFGKPVADVSLHYAQHTLHGVRTVDVHDSKVGKKGNDNTQQVVDQTLKMTLGQDWSAQPGDKGYDPKKPDSNLNRASAVQGMVFSDNPEVTKKLVDTLNAVAAGNTENPAVTSYAQSQRPQGQSVDLTQEMQQAQKRHLADSVSTEVLLRLNPGLKEKNLQKEARKGTLENNFNTLLLTGTKGPQDIVDRQNGALEQLAKDRKEFPALANYYDEVEKQIRTVCQDPANIDKTKPSLAVKANEIDPQALGAQYAISLAKGSSDAEIKTAAKLFDKGLVERLVSEGPLGTGYSNPNVLSTISIQTKDLAVGGSMTQAQQLGRPIRDDDGRAFVGTVVDANVKLRNTSAAQVFDVQGNKFYQQGVANENELQKGRSTAAVATELEWKAAVTAKDRQTTKTEVPTPETSIQERKNMLATKKEKGVNKEKVPTQATTLEDRKRMLAAKKEVVPSRESIPTPETSVQQTKAKFTEMLQKQQNRTDPPQQQR